MDLVESKVDEVIVFEPRGRIDSATANRFGERLIAGLRAGSHRVVVDLKGINYISSAGFRALLIVPLLSKM